MKKALFFWGGWDGHEPKQCVDVFAPWLENKGFDVLVSDNMNVLLDEGLMKSLSLIVPVWTMGEIGNEHWGMLDKTVLEGCSLAGTAECATQIRHTFRGVMESVRSVKKPLPLFFCVPPPSFARNVKFSGF